MRYAHAHPNPELQVIVTLAIETAMRQGEILKLRWENINLRTRIAHLPETKNGTARDVPLSLRARDALLKLGVQTKGTVFTYTSAGVKSTWRYMMTALAIDDLHFTTCDMRQSPGSLRWVRSIFWRSRRSVAIKASPCLSVTPTM